MTQVEAADGAAISYEVVGAGDDLVLVHGITESRRSWGSLVDRFVAEGYRVVSVDLRGHGESGRAATYDLASMAGDIGTVCAAVGATSPLLVGHSLGGAVVSAYAAGGPCRGVVNVDQPLALSAFKETLGALEPLLRGTPEQFQQAIAAVFEQMAGALDGDERARIDSLRRADQEVVLGVWDLVLTASVADLDAVVEQLAGAITVPYLALHGIDPGPGYAEWLTGLVPAAAVEVWPDLGHYPHLVEPDRFVARVVAFDRG